MRQGTRLEVAYFDQMRSALDLDATLADSVSPGSEWVETASGRKHVMSYLTDFLFSPERANSPLRTLSGGERNRVLLARLFALPANVLVLDEPTNDLDIDTLELLEELLQSYAGTVFLVSHDRRFLDNVVTSTIAWEGDESPGLLARVRRRLRGLEDAAGARAPRPARRERDARPQRRVGKGAPPRRPVRAGRAAPAKPRKLSYKEQRELDGAAGAHRGARRRAEGSRRLARERRALRRATRCAPRRRRCATRRSTTSCWPRSSAGKRSAHPSDAAATAQAGMLADRMHMHPIDSPDATP